MTMMRKAASWWPVIAIFQREVCSTYNYNGVTPSIGTDDWNRFDSGSVHSHTRSWSVDKRTIIQPFKWRPTSSCGTSSVDVNEQNHAPTTDSSTTDFPAFHDAEVCHAVSTSGNTHIPTIATTCHNAYRAIRPSPMRRTGPPGPACQRLNPWSVDCVLCNQYEILQRSLPHYPLITDR